MNVEQAFGLPRRDPLLRRQAHPGGGANAGRCLVRLDDGSSPASARRRRARSSAARPRGSSPGCGPYAKAILRGMSDRLRVAASRSSSGTEGGQPRDGRGASSPGRPRPGPTSSSSPRSGTRSAPSRRCARTPSRSTAAVRPGASGWAREHGITLVGGSITEVREGREKLSNTCVVSTPTASSSPSTARSTCSTSRSAATSTASPSEEPGDETSSATAEGWQLGLTVCYDLRFPELFRVCPRGRRGHPVPAAFTLSPAATTGRSCSAPARSRTSASSSAANQSGTHAAARRATAAR